MNWKKQFDEKFPWASFAWNGDNEIGIRFAKNKKAQVKRFILREIIEKLIADIPSYSIENDRDIQQLRDKWIN